MKAGKKILISLGFLACIGFIIDTALADLPRQRVRGSVSFASDEGTEVSDGIVLVSSRGRGGGRGGGHGGGGRSGMRGGGRRGGGRSGMHGGGRRSGGRSGMRSGGRRGGRPSGMRNSGRRGGRPSGMRSSGRRGGRPSGMRNSGRRGGRPSGMRSSGRRSGRPSGMRSSGRRGGRPSGIRSSGRRSGGSGHSVGSRGYRSQSRRAPSRGGPRYRSHSGTRRRGDHGTVRSRSNHDRRRPGHGYRSNRDHRRHDGGRRGRYHGRYHGDRYSRSRFGFSLFLGWPYYWYYYPYDYYYYYGPSRQYYYYYYDSPSYYPPANSEDYGYRNNNDVSQQQYGRQDTFDDVREKMAKQRAAEAPKVAERLHLMAVAFQSGNYSEALNLAGRAVKDYPYHPVLEFVYSHTLFANGEYDKSADVLREAMLKVDIQRQPVIFGAELYPDRNALIEKIDLLTEASRSYPGNAALQLLLGYQLAVADRNDEALRALAQAKGDHVNRPAAARLEQALSQAEKTDK